MRHLFLIRHGETEWSRDRKHTGRTDVPLTATGIEQARQLGRCLRETKFDYVCTSPLRRAHETAALAGYGAVAEVDPDLVEWDYGQYEGKTTAEIRAHRPDWNLVRDGCPGGESPTQVIARVDRVIDRVLARASTNVALFAHGHFLRVFTARWLGWPLETASSLQLGPASLSILLFEPNGPRHLSLWNYPSRDLPPAPRV